MSQLPVIVTSSSASALSVSGFDGNVAGYLRKIRSFPMLTEAEEHRLALRWRDHGDLDAAHRLVTSHMRLVVKIAMRYRGYGLPISDLISEGAVGLMHAVKKFDVDKGYRLATYAMWWIRATMQEYILHSWSLVKIGTTTAQKKLFFNLRRLRNKLQTVDQDHLTHESITTIAKQLSVTPQDVTDMESRIRSHDKSLNTTIAHDDEHRTWIDTLADPAPAAEQVMMISDERLKQRQVLQQAIATLNDRERAIVLKRRIQDPPVTLEELSKTYSVSCERIRQIENRAMQKLQASAQEIVQSLPPM